MVRSSGKWTMYLVSLHGHRVRLARLERRADRVQARDVVGLGLLHPAQHVDAAARHDAHGHDDVLRVGDLDAEHRVRGVQVAHDERMTYIVRPACSPHTGPA